MEKALLIAEKPSLMKAIMSVYNKNKKIIPYDICFLSFAGHIMSLKQPQEYNSNWEKWNRNDLPIIPKKFTYKVVNQSLFDKIDKNIKDNKYKVIINACDSGREGQLIFWSFIDFIRPNIHKEDTKILRLWSNDVTEKGILKALTSLIDEKKDSRLIALTMSSKLRTAADWLIGINLSRAIGMKSNIKNVGRVKTPITKIIVDRELEILNFKKKIYYTIEILYNNKSFKAKMYNSETKSQEKFANKDEALKIIKSIGKTHIVKEIIKNKICKVSPSCHSLSMLQIEANKTYGYTMTKTLEIAQSLYEKGILSYPRTDTGFLTDEVAKELPKALNSLKVFSNLEPYIINIEKNISSQIKKIISDKKYVDSSKVTDHYGIIPTGNKIVLSNLNADEISILTIVAKRLVSIFMNPIVQENTLLKICNSDPSPNILNREYLFVASGKVTVDKGYSVLYKKIKEDELPNLKKGDICSVSSLYENEEETKPPNRFTDATLNEILENIQNIVNEKQYKDTLKAAKGIGTPATRGSIIDDLVKCNLIQRKGKKFFASDIAIELINKIGDFMIASPILTAEIEQHLYDIEKLKNKDIMNTYKFIVDFVNSSIKEIDKIKPSHNFTNPTSKYFHIIGKCPICGGNVLESEKAVFCENKTEKDCFLIAKTIKGVKITKEDITKLLNKKTIEKSITNTNKQAEDCLISLDYETKKLLFDFKR